MNYVAPILIRATAMVNEITDLQELAELLATSSGAAVAMALASRELPEAEIAQGLEGVNEPPSTPLRALAAAFTPASSGSLMATAPGGRRATAAALASTDGPCLCATERHPFAATKASGATTARGAQSARTADPASVAPRSATWASW